MAEATTYLDAAYRALVWCGYAGLGGAFALLLVWPQGARQRRLALTALAGSGLIAAATLGWLLLRLVAGDDVPRVEGAAAIARLAVLAAVGGAFTDLLDRPIRGRRRAGVVAALVCLTATVLAGAIGGVPGQLGTSLTGDAYVALAALVLGACVTVVAVVRPGDARAHLPLLREEAARLTRPALGATALAGAVHAVAAERSGLAVPVPVVVLQVVLLVACLAAVLVTRRVVRGPQEPGGGSSRTASTFPAALGAAPVAPRQAPSPARAPDPVAGRFAKVSVDRRPAVGVYAGPRPAPAGRPPAVVVLPDTAAAAAAAAAGEQPVEVDEQESASARGRRPSARAQTGARYVAGVGRLPLPDHADGAPVRRTVRVAGAAEPLVVELPGSRTTPTTR